MSILVNKNTRVICQGITGKAGQFHTTALQGLRHEHGRRRDARSRRAGVRGHPDLRYGGRGSGEDGADATMIFVPPPFAADAIMEAADAGIRIVVAITEGIPVRDMVRAAKSSAAAACGSSVRTAPASSRPTSARSASCRATSIRKARWA